MNIIMYILGITILLQNGTDSLIEDTKTDKNHQQRILFRKLQNFQETKPLTWNEVLADVLVNKIGIFSFKRQDKEDVIKDNAPVVKERTVLTNFFSNVFFVYKKFVYDTFVGKRKEIDENHTVYITPLKPKSDEEDSNNIESEDVIIPEIKYVKGPKSEVELVEPKYHGKFTLDESTTTNPSYENADPNAKRNSNPETTNSDNSDIKPDIENSKKNIDPSKEDSANCAEGYVNSENGQCVNSLRLMLAIPSQCPLGYRKDRLGYCRIVF